MKKKTKIFFFKTKNFGVISSNLVKYSYFILLVRKGNVDGSSNLKKSQKPLIFVEIVIKLNKPSNGMATFISWLLKTYNYSSS